MEKKNFQQIIDDNQRYRLYNKESKNLTKISKKLKDSVEQSSELNNLFFNQLVKLCTCKDDNILLNNLGKDISIANIELKKVNENYKHSFNDIFNQLEQIEKKFNYTDKYEIKYKQAHLSRVKYQNRTKNLSDLFYKTFSIKARNLNDDISSLSNNLAIDCNNHNKTIDYKLSKLYKEENYKEKKLLAYNLNEELALIIRVRKLIKKFCANQIQFGRDLITLFSQLDQFTERDVPEVILELNQFDLEKYLRPIKMHLMSPFSNKAFEQLNQNILKNKDENIAFSPNFSNMANYNNYLEYYEPPKQFCDLNKTKNESNLYYKSLCSLNDNSNIINQKENKKIDYNCQVCSPKLLEIDNSKCKWNEINLDYKKNLIKNQNTLKPVFEKTNCLEHDLKPFSSAASAPIEELKNENELIEKKSFWINSCDQCKNYQTIAEDAANNFVANYQSFKTHLQQCASKELTKNESIIEKNLIIN